jgi:hypothetical protein
MRLTKKTITLTAKMLIAAGLLAWVLSGVHWRDFAKDAAGGKTHSILQHEGQGAEQRLLVHTGGWWSGRNEWRPASAFRQVPGGGVIREGFVSTLVRINLPLAVMGSLGFGASMLICAYRWRWLLHILGIEVSLWEAVRLTFLGQFFNAVVPGTVGGDLVKAYYVSKHTSRKAAVLLSVLVDRMVGMAGLAMLAAVMLAVVLLAGLEKFERVRMSAISVAVILPATGFGVALLLSRRLRGLLHVGKLMGRTAIWRHIEAAGEAARTYRQRLGAVAMTVPMTFASHVVFVGFVAVIGRALGVPTPWYHYYLYVPLIYTIGAVPLTPGGVGLVEKLFVEFFQTALATPSMILVLAMLARLVPVLWGIPGAVVAVTGARPPKVDQIQQEMGLRAAGER